MLLSKLAALFFFFCEWERASAVIDGQGGNGEVIRPTNHGTDCHSVSSLFLDQGEACRIHSLFPWFPEATSFLFLCVFVERVSGWSGYPYYTDKGSITFFNLVQGWFQRFKLHFNLKNLCFPCCGSEPNWMNMLYKYCGLVTLLDSEKISSFLQYKWSVSLSLFILNAT